MRRHRSSGLLAGTLLALVLVGSVLAKTGEDQAVITLDTPKAPHAGAPIQVGALITRSDGSAIRGLVVTFQLVKDGGIGLVSAYASEASMGHYVATMTIPEEGAWTVVATAVGEGGSETFHAGDLQIGAPLAVSPPVEPTALQVPSWALVTGLIVVVLAAGAGAWILTVRRRSAIATHRA